MSLATAINARTRTPTLVLRVNNRRVSGGLSVNISQQYGQGVGGGTVLLRDPIDTPVPGMPISWQWGYNGFTVPGFTGYIVTPEISSYPNVWSLEVRDVLWLAEREQQTIVTSPLNNITAQNAIRYILETYAGITRHDIPDIQMSGGTWTLGTLTPVQWDKSTALAACQEIAATAGYWIYADAGGTVRARLMERAPSDSPFRTLRGGDAAGASLLVQGAPKKKQDGNQVKNRITVTGANTGVEGAQLRDQFLATHALYPGVIDDLSFNSFLLEYIADLTSVAERLAALYNRVPNSVTARIKADPRFNVGMTLGIEDSSIGYGTAKNFFVFRLNQSFDNQSGEFSQDILLDGGLGDAGFTTIPPPIAVIATNVELETLDGTPVAVIGLDGSGSYSQSEGEIVSWFWSMDVAPYGGSPSTATGETATLIVGASSPPTITLVVTDTSSKTGTASVLLDLADPAATTYETVSIAFGAAWLMTLNGGGTWNENIDTTTRVPPIGGGVDDRATLTDSATYGALASGGADLYQSLDTLGTPATTLNTASGTITALSVNVANASRVWRAVGDTVQRSIDGGTTWASWGTPLPGTDVLDILEDPAVDNSVFCLAGADFYQSIGTSPSWGVFYAGPVGAVARWIQRSISGVITWVCYTGTFTGSPLQRVEGGIGVTFPVVSPTVDEIVAFTLNDMISPGAPQIVAIDQENRIWTLDGQTGLGVTASGETSPAGGIVKHAQHSYQSEIVYIAYFDSVAAGTGGVYKYFPQGDTLLKYKDGSTGQQAHMIGIASRATATIATILRLPSGATGAADVLFIYEAGVWTSKALPEANQTEWRSVQANPLNPNELLLFRWGSGNALWYSPDFGDSWVNIFTNLPSRSDQTVPVPQWSWSVGGGWAVTAHGVTSGDRTRLARGIRDSYSLVIDIASGTYDRFGIGAGQSDDLAMINVDGAFYYIDSGNTINTAGSGSSGFVNFDRVGQSGRRMVAARVVSVPTVLKCSDYRSGAWSAISGAEGFMVAALGDGSAIYVGQRNDGGRTGVQEILNPFGSPSDSIVAGTGESIGNIRSDRQTQTIIAAGVGSFIDGWSDTLVRAIDGTWSRVLKPSFATDLSPWVEPVVREVL